jgi:hypothetical protein
VSPGNATFTAAVIVLNGSSAVPEFESLPLTETWNSLAEIVEMLNIIRIKLIQNLFILFHY